MNSAQETVRDPEPPSAVVDAVALSDSAALHRDTIPAGELEADGGAQVRISEEFDETVDVAVPTQRPNSDDPAMQALALSQAGRFDKTLTGDSSDLSLSEALYDPETEEDELADPLIGLVVADRYRIVERVGRGGMGIVYRVEHVRIGKVLAMKLLAGELSANKEIVRRFKLEALTVSKLSSPHTVQVFDYGVWNHLTYLVMELVDGHDLSRALRKGGPMPFSRLGRLVIQVCASLQEAHDKGIVHRDIKPENIMVITDSRGVEIAKVLDFGLAKLRESPELNQVTLQGSVVGTPYYMSPEQVYGDEVDGRTDLYSLGAVMFRALTGTYPFNARSPMGMFTKHLTEAPPSPCERKPELNIPLGVSAAVQKCMAKEPAERFQTIEELRDLLLEELNALPMSSADRLLIDESSSDHSPPKKKRKVREVAVALPADELAKSVIATREEIDRYERKLRRNRYGAWVLLGALLVGGAGGAVYAYREGRLSFDGKEREPNNSANEATPLPLGQEITAFLGKRLEEGRGDRDFFRFDVPEATQPHIGVSVSPLPNMATCSVLYRVGVTQPLAQYCTGAPGVPLAIETLRLEPGSYLLAVSQDLTRDASGLAPPIHENISDAYTVKIDATEPKVNLEVEPNDRVASAQLLAAGSKLTGTLGWAGDEDVYCVDRTISKGVRWRVVDAPERPRGTVLEATPMVGDTAQPLVRVHPGASQPFGRPQLEADHGSPWTSPSYDAGAQRCLRLRLSTDPWAERPLPVRPNGAAYEIEVVAGDAPVDPPPGPPDKKELRKKGNKPAPKPAPKKASTASPAPDSPSKAPAPTAAPKAPPASKDPAGE